MRQKTDIHIITHLPTSPEGQAELARRLAEAHALTAGSYVRKLSCPIEQKHRLIQAILDESQLAHSET